MSMPKDDKKLLSPVYREISERCGFETALEIYHMFRGQQISFPVRIFDKEAVHERIAAEYDGTNARKLAEEYSYSEKTIRRIVKDRKEAKTREASEEVQKKENTK